MFCIFAVSMERILIILFLALLSVVLHSQTTMNIHPVHSLINSENAMDPCVEIEDNCEEDIISNNIGSLFHLSLEENLSRTVSAYPVKIALFIWQPPE